MPRIDWSRAKAPRPSLHKSEEVNHHDQLGRRARQALAIWKKRLPHQQRKKLEAVLTR